MRSKQQADLQQVKIASVQAHARLHMGFFDQHGGLGRKFGSLGLALESPVSEIEASIADRFAILGDVDAKSIQNIIKIIQLLQKTFNLQTSVKLNIKQLISNHAGLGSGTQLALSVVALFDKLYNLNLDQSQIATLSGRGMRSGIGLATFWQGGVVVDAGRNNLTKIPPVIARVDFPEEWRILLIFDNSQCGVHGEQELIAFEKLPEFPSNLADKLCRHVLMQALPALHEHDLPSFGTAVRALQIATGEHFAKAQSGMYASQKVAGVLNYLENQDVACFGQSSWGPTGFAIVENEVKANLYLEQLKKRFAGESNLSFVVTQGYNQGATIKLAQ